MNKEDVVHTYNKMGYYPAIKKKDIWVWCSEANELKPIIQSEVNQKGKKYIKTYIWNLEKKVLMNLFAKQEWNADVENGLVDTAVGGEGGMNWDK